MTTQARELAKLVTNAGDLNLGDDISLASDGAVLNFGADSDVTLTHVADTGLLLNSSRKIQFGDSGTWISQSADGVLNLTSDTEVEINATTVDINANVDISGNLVLGGNITIGDADSDDISFGGELTSHIIPNADDTYDLGSSTKKWRNAYVDGTLYVDNIDTLNVSVDTDSVAEIGRAHVGGGITGLSDYAIFSHLHAADSGGYALAQNASGATFLNADDGQDITFLAHGTSIATLASDATLTLTGGLVIPSTITHAGDTDTKLDFNQANTMRLIAGDTTAWIANATSMVINEDSADFDFRVESNDSANMLSVDGGDNTVTIAANNTASVTNSATALAARTLIINGNESEGSDNLSIFAMADGTGNYGMEVSNSAHTAQYDLLINPIMGGNVGIGTTSALDRLDIMGGGYDQIRIGSNKTDNTNKTAGIVSTNYANQSVSLFQMFNQNGNNALYYGSADGSHRGLQNHYFYTNAGYNATSSHTKMMEINYLGQIKSGSGGMVLQTKESYNSTAQSVGNAGSVTVNSTTITIKEDSKIAVWFHSGQVQNNGNGQNPNGNIQWENSGGTSTNITDHNGNHYGWDASTHVERMFFMAQGISTALSAGTYTVRFIGSAYNGTVIWNYQGQGSHMIIQEISAD